MMEEKSDIDQILAKVKAEESKRGKLKIFFGAVAGVGKTYAMLEAARLRKKEGVDVVVGYVETHKRAETEMLLEELDVLPPKKIMYRGIELREFDLDEALKRKPSLILVDELAHTNAPGVRHAKRWQDIEELLNHGIDAYTTLNVQHCESVHDLVAQITGVAVKEAVPDSFLEMADDIELIDLPSEELLKRLKEGKVYLGPQAERAAMNFFKPGNLIALRQLALRYTARSVDAKMRAYKEMYSISKVWKASDRFLVCISGDPSAIRLIRSAKRIASETGADWIVAYVETPSFTRRPYRQNQVDTLIRSAEKLGAEAIVLSGQRISETLLAYARSKNIGKIIVGKPKRLWLSELITGSVVNELARQSGEIDIYILSGEVEEKIPKPISVQRRPPSWKGAFGSVMVLVLCTMVNSLLFPVVELSNLIMVYLLGIICVAFFFGKRIAFLLSLLSVLCFDYFFVPPYFTFAVTDVQYIITFIVMLITGLVVNTLADRLRTQTISARLREEHNQILYALNKELSKTSDSEEVIKIAVKHLEEFCKCPVAIFGVDQNKSAVVQAKGSLSLPLTSNEEGVINWVYEHGKMAGRGTDTLPGSKGIYLSLVGTEKTVGVFGAFPGDSQLLSDSRKMHFLEMIVAQTALAIEGAQLAAAMIRAEYAIEDERIRNLFLTSFSHDVPQKLNTVSRTISQLLEDDKIGQEEKKRLAEQIRFEAEQLDMLTAELHRILKSSAGSVRDKK
ncbi:MAG: two-component system sensor histidine kinase KdbD [Candidatus Brocadia sp. WS118]|nr:MAG: two-component system sensor histidine kinase KdbD [Candidatus Brocadia sp. WS118]